MTPPRPSRFARAALLSFGAGVAPALAALGLFGLDDLRLVAEGRMRSDAAVRARAAQSEWEARLSRSQPIAAALLDLEWRELAWGEPESREEAPSGTDAGPEADPVLPAQEDPTRPARLHLLAARADLAAGRVALARKHLEDALQADPGVVGASVLTVAQGLRRLGDQGGQVTEAAAVYRTFVSGRAFSVPVGGAEGSETSARFLALLCAERWLPEGTRDAEIAALLRAAAAHELALPPPSLDSVEWTEDGPSLLSDPWWTALESQARERLGQEGVNWSTAFRRDERLVRALVKSWPASWLENEGNRWTLHRLPPASTWAALRATGDGGWRVAVHRSAQLDAALGAALDPDEGFVVRAFLDGAEPEALTEPLALAGAPVTLRLLHPQPDQLMAPMTRRFRALRLGLLSVAALIALAAAFAWGALRRDARLRAMRSTFVASVSHDLRTPVASIGLLAENMAHGYHRGAEASYIDSLQSEAARLRRLIDDLLDFGRIERGLPPQVRREAVMLEQWLRAFAAQERVRCHDLGCALDLVTEDLPPSAHLDLHAMERALGNLIHNAIRHGQAKSIELRVRAALDTLVFEVVDGGTGLSPAALRTDLFRPFERGSALTDGTGLGLSIVRAVAEGHGGSAALRPRPGKGGTVASISISLNHEASA